MGPLQIGARARIELGLVMVVVLVICSCSTPRNELLDDGGPPASGSDAPIAREGGASNPEGHGDAPAGLSPPDTAGSGPGRVDATPIMPGELPPCPIGTHRCGSTCESNMSLSSCGSFACTPCTAPAGARATCDGQACGLACPSGYHACGARCLYDESPQSCGDRCTDCPQLPNSDATCKARQCVPVCHQRFYSCNGACVDSENTSACADRKVIRVPRAEAPPRTADAQPRCVSSDDGKQVADCPVLEYGGYRVWPFTYDELSNSALLIRVYQGTSLVKELQGTGAHQVWKVIFDDLSVYFYGTDDGTDNGLTLVSWDDLPGR